ncbi:acyl-coenzyme A amino acid N-acyltransferase 2-like [Amphiura filiformis]|uniref:acyl-coenzyme A amino acid N-acyltransferase 2-like n=1 Tax=Amphiura filiformis TaxID=82378 RepID=UPI003B21B4B9
MASIQVSPSPAMVDEKLTIIVKGLNVGSKVTIRSFVTEGRFKFEAHAHYVVDHRGEIHIAEQPSHGGTYTGVEPMGLFWGMQSCPGQRQGIRYMKLDVTTPASTTLSLHKGHLDTSTLQDDQPITTTTVDRWYMAKNVQRIPIRHGRIRGVLFKPKGPGPFPGVIDLFGAAGGCIQIRAALLASHGFAAFALAFFGYEDLPKAAWNLDCEYFEEAVDYFSGIYYIETGGIGVVGVSTGAMVALLIASLYPDKISAVVSISGPVAMFPFPLLLKGEVMEYIGWEFDRVQKGPDGGYMMRYAADSLQIAPEGAKIKVEKARNLLLIYGDADLDWPTDEHTSEAIKRLDAHGHHGYKMLCYHGAGHLIEPPYAPTTSVSFFKGEVIAWGGTPKPHADAMEDSWKHILEFLSNHIGYGTLNTEYSWIKSLL